MKDKMAVKKTHHFVFKESGFEIPHHFVFVKYIITLSLGGLMPNVGSLRFVFDQLFSSLALSRVLKKIHSGL